MTHPASKAVGPEGISEEQLEQWERDATLKGRPSLARDDYDSRLTALISEVRRLRDDLKRHQVALQELNNFARHDDECPLASDDHLEDEGCECGLFAIGREFHGEVAS